MKVLDADSLHSGIEETLADLDSLQGKIKQMQKSVDGIINLEDSFKGKGAQAIRSFYQEVHVPFLLFFEGLITDFQDTLKQMTRSVEMLEPDRQGFIRQSFLENDVQQGLTKAENVTSTLTDEANHAIASVQDIISLPRLDDGEFRYNVNRSRKQADETIEQLHQFDAQGMQALGSVEKDLHLMSNYIQQLSGMFDSGKLNVDNYATRQLSDNDTYKGLIQGVKKKAVRNAFSIDVMLASGAKYILSHYLPLSSVLVDLLLKSYEKRTMDYSVRAMNVVINVNSKSISHEEFQTLQSKGVNAKSVVDYKGKLDGKYYTPLDGGVIRQYEKEDEETIYQFVSSVPKDRHEPEVETNPFKKTLNSIGEIGKDFTTSWGKRSDKAFDSWYGFANHFTFGAFDLGKDMWEGNQMRYEQMETPADVANWLTMGGVDLAKGAINPNEALSKEHLLASFGITTMLAGGALKMPPGAKGSQPPKTNPTVKVPTKPPNIPVKKWAAQLKPPVIKSVTNISEWFRVNFLNFPRREFAVDMPGGNNSGYYYMSDSGKKNSADIPRIPKSTYEERLVQTPINNGKWTDKRGESTFISEHEEAKIILDSINKEGIEYSNAVPDFSPISKGEVKITDMSTERRINFRKADELLAKELGVTRKEIVKMRKTQKLTWHELNDMCTMQLVPTTINSKFGHLGGVSEIKKLLE